MSSISRRCHEPYTTNWYARMCVCVQNSRYVDNPAPNTGLPKETNLSMCWVAVQQVISSFTWDLRFSVDSGSTVKSRGCSDTPPCPH